MAYEGWELMRALRDFNTEAKMKNLRVKEFKLTLDEFYILSRTLSALSTHKRISSWSENPVFDGVPIKIV